ncbi:MAG: translation elongation factor 4 [Dehalococcoidia bacterium]|nr:elongation factor 4 [Chloroflexota bacterium]RZP14003.1 MAG: elongation factor 4 [Chloroflexota bacterium]|tara:strand:- start:818 stop:2626 length:1809 start_codon:yes stop_codon:yes gene_type:complete
MRIRNFSIIAHIDHGKSTLADRFIEFTNTISSRNLKDQVLDTMDLERERGITIKAQTIQLNYKYENKEYILNLIDTPGHVDFTYEVSRSLAACEGALLLIDATQGVQAQTISTIYQAIDQDLVIIPVINKIDSPLAETDKIISEVSEILGFDESEILKVSAKDGTGVDKLLEKIIEKIPSPKDSNENDGLKALIFDSIYDSFKGAIAYVKVFNGKITKGQKLYFHNSETELEAIDIGYLKPHQVSSKSLTTGYVGYVETGIKNLKDIKVGDTIFDIDHKESKPLIGYKESSPTVYTGLYPVDSDKYQELRDALDKLYLNDPSLVYEPETSAALGFGFRCGFLGMLHMEIIQERLEREYDLELITTAPSVTHSVYMKNGEVNKIQNPSEWPETQHIDYITEPWVKTTIITPENYIGKVTEFLSNKRGEFGQIDYIQNSKNVSNQRVIITHFLPLSEILIDFFDGLKSCSSGYASMDYELIEERIASLVKLDILVNHENVDSLSLITDKTRAAYKGRGLVSKLKELIPRQMFQVPVQAAIGGKIVARENISALRKNVLAKCYGGDVTRKRKLLEQQAKGKKRRMKMIGSVEVPQEAFMAVLKID